MKINSVQTSQALVVNSVNSGKKPEVATEKKEAPKKGDTLQLSAQAVALSKAKTEGGDSRLDEVRSRVESGYYEKPEVQKQAAAKLLKSVYGA